MPVTITATFAEIKFKKKRLMIKNIVKLEITVIIQVNTEVLHLAYVI